MSKRIKRLALTSLLSALSATLLIIGSVFEMLDLTVAALASVCVILAYVEMGTKYALCVWAVSSILSLALLPSSAGIYFAMFLGFYPVVKIWVEKLKKVLAYILKFLIFNLSITAVLLSFRFILGLQDGTPALFAVLYVCFNVFCFIYDVVLSRIIMLYIYKFRQKLGFDRIFK